MNGRIAGLSFLVVCVILAALLLLKVITPIISGILFAIALVTLGASSRGFRRPRRDE